MTIFAPGFAPGLAFGLPGGPELFIIFLAVLLIFGARKLPGLARAMGSSITQFKKGMSDDAPMLDEQSPGAGDTTGTEGEDETKDKA